MGCRRGVVLPDLFLGVPAMMDDHATICRARNALCDALKVLLNADIMDESDFAASRQHALAALAALDELLYGEGAADSTTRASWARGDR
jgi:hypothetical protein